MKSIFILSFLLPYFAFAQKQDTIVTDPMVLRVLDSCGRSKSKIEYISRADVPERIKKYLKKHAYHLCFWDLKGRGNDAFYLVSACADGYVPDVLEYFYFNANYKFIKSGVYFCDVCF